MDANTTAAITRNRILEFAAGEAAARGCPDAVLRPPLRGRVALVAGATHGIGRCAAIALAQRGATVAIHYDDDLSGAESLCKVIASFGSRPAAVQADLGAEDACRRLAASVFETLGHVDILVHTAAAIREPQIHRMHRAQWDEVVHDHLGAAYNLTRAVINPMRQRNCGRIVLVAEPPLIRTGCTRPCPTPATAALAGLARTLAMENAGHGITANCICPGMIESGELSISVRERDRVQAAIPLARFGRPEEIAGLIEFLASPRAAYITGQIFHIDGGLSL